MPTYVSSMCAVSADEILLTSESGLRAVSLRTGHDTALFPWSDFYAFRVAFDALTDTLLVIDSLTDPSFRHTLKQWQLVSLRRNGSEWLEVQRLNITINRFDHPSITVCDSSVLLKSITAIYVFDVSAAHTARSRHCDSTESAESVRDSTGRIHLQSPRR